ncbi:MAG: 30S ribosomal protein S17 [candidate division CPR1 bacterium GW2011_GWC1_49_13]|uniref:30S ribosomal protein S17 n=1 Tax=candidate division CPR1 bacterium GW2011_GWC1_49_13 TaxID=1618342 RepID=A0A0G1VHQ4_9BACT|nr:MAG: 30S ribosomal protein S17 [candidate division CPR1 bacterium GW2011_GWC1_49_13]
MPKKVLAGTIKGITGPQTVRVEVVRTFHHPRYKKRVQVSKSYLAHFTGEAQVGQTVSIEETKPLSARKHFKVISLDGKAVEAAVQVEKPVVKKSKKEKKQ